MGDSQEIIQEFLVESYENLDRLDQEFVALEKDPQNSEMLSSIFRTMHTIKGTCGFLGFSKLESVAHVGENLLSKMREGQIRLDGEITTALLQTVDAVRSILAEIETTQSEGEGSYLELVERLTKLSAGRAAAAEAEALVAAEPAPVEVVEPAAVVAAIDPVDAMLEEEVRKSNIAFRERAAGLAAATALDVSAATVLPQHEAVVPSSEARGEAGEKSNHLAESNVRVDVGLLDRLMNLVGELVLARNQVLMCSARSKETTLVGTSQSLNLITSELQEAVMRTRMQPIGNVWNKLPRVIRDLSVACGKQIRIEMDGKETELDKTILEAIKDPLTHIVRNSVDHGIERPEVRLKAGKPAEGCLRLRAFHEGGQVNIEISDDGAGVSLEKVKRKALERGLITAEQAAQLTEREAGLLLFKPGFSTAEKITNVSGRGVGMDVVKTNIEKIGGTVDMQSVAGQGTTLRIRIPLTLAIIPALVVTSGGDRFAIPQVSLLELVRLEGAQAKANIERIHGTPVYRLRGNLLPLVYLNEQLRLEGDAASDVVNIVVLQADETNFGLVVDQINDTEEIVVKPLGKLFKGMTTFAGATIMGDGRVALILDVMGVAQKAKVLSEGESASRHELAQQGKNSGSDKQQLLLFRITESRRLAIPLSLVARLEEFPASAVEYSGVQRVTQYRGRIMPLISLLEFLARRNDPAAVPIAGAAAAGTSIQVIVYTQGDQSVGLIVESILDVVEQAVKLEQTNPVPGVLGSAVIDNKVTEMLDVEAVVRAALGGTAAQAA